ncbi:restriction endonuclease [Pedobacter sp. SG908]|uniref:McrC family protein n=1 Tax=Pedobacter sp. SG908 TaxID=2587135 RepID=UPI001420CD86|nr:restriction endonuclease [Pedobacter sp. SG908]NII83169.1 5-methylcytosine-specific restriction enzyme subunit McrC [Pedobacter sp. SG908]
MITVYEHDSLYLHKGNQRLSDDELLSLQLFYREKNFPYYSLVHNGVRFCEYVGVIRVGKLTIEILPKADRQHNETHWRELLIDMLKSSVFPETRAPSTAQLSLKSNSILDHYFELFIAEVEQLTHSGLIKKYRKIEQNSTTLKGKLLFPKHIAVNLVHQERFYISQQTYDHSHLLNQILLKALRMLNRSRLHPSLSSRLANLMLNFPDLADIKVSEDTFSGISYDRKNAGYQKAIDIARLILLNYHPDLNSGSRDVLALLFNMNVLWERFVLKSLQRYRPDIYMVRGQTNRNFWRPETGYTRTMRPDILIGSDEKPLCLLDTKWKNVKDSAASDDDLRQMYTYSRYHNGAKICLIYPGESYQFFKGVFMDEIDNHTVSNQECGVLKIKLLNGRSSGQQELAYQVMSLLGFEPRKKTVPEIVRDFSVPLI